MDGGERVEGVGNVIWVASGKTDGAGPVKSRLTALDQPPVLRGSRGLKEAAG